MTVCTDAAYWHPPIWLLQLPASPDDAYSLDRTASVLGHDKGEKNMALLVLGGVGGGCWRLALHSQDWQGTLDSDSDFEERSHTCRPVLGPAT